MLAEVYLLTVLSMKSKYSLLSCNNLNRWQIKDRWADGVLKRKGGSNSTRDVGMNWEKPGKQAAVFTLNGNPDFHVQ